MMKEVLTKILIILLSPTFVRASIIKSNGKNDNNDFNRAKVIKKLNIQNLTISISFMILLGISKPLISNINLLNGIILFLIAYYSFSRCNEVFMAFLKDAKEKMKYRPKSGKGLKYNDRLTLALKSYLELIINYGMIYYILNSSFLKEIYLKNELTFNYDFKNLGEAIYYSATTITTLGYGDFAPTCNITQFLSIYEVVNGLFLLGVSFTIYVSLNFMPDNDLSSFSSVRKDTKCIYKYKTLLIVFIVFISINIYIINTWINKIN